MDLHEDLQSFRGAQRVLQNEEVADRVLDLVNRDARFIDGYLIARNCSQAGKPAPTQLRTQFYLGDERVMSRPLPLEINNREAMLMSSSSGDVLDMYEWHKGAGNTDLHSYIVAHNDTAKQYAQQFAKAPEIPPYAEELSVNPNGEVAAPEEPVDVVPPWMRPRPPPPNAHQGPVPPPPFYPRPPPLDYFRPSGGDGGGGGGGDGGGGGGGGGGGILGSSGLPGYAGVAYSSVSDYRRDLHNEYSGNDLGNDAGGLGPVARELYEGAEANAMASTGPNAAVQQAAISRAAGVSNAAAASASAGASSAGRWESAADVAARANLRQRSGADRELNADMMRERHAVLRAIVEVRRALQYSEEKGEDDLVERYKQRLAQYMDQARRLGVQFGHDSAAHVGRVDFPSRDEVLRDARFGQNVASLRRDGRSDSAFAHYHLPGDFKEDEDGAGGYPGGGGGDQGLHIRAPRALAPHQIAGSSEAKAHMASLRARRGRKE